MNPVFPTNEVERLAALRKLNLLDTPPEERFDRITRLTARLFHAPISMITLIDTERQWAKSLYGPASREIPRNLSFCAHTILGDDTFVVPDTRRDARFSDHPMVKEAPFIRFYAGHPISAPDGSKLGAHCILDVRPRRMTETNRKAMKDLAELTRREMGGYPTEERRLILHPPAEGEDRTASRYLSDVSYEFRTPLNAIIGYSRLLLDEVYGALHESQKTALERIFQNANALLSLLGGLAHLIETERGKINPPQKGR